MFLVSTFFCFRSWKAFHKVQYTPSLARHLCRAERSEASAFFHEGRTKSLDKKSKAHESFLTLLVFMLSWFYRQFVSIQILNETLEGNSLVMKNNSNLSGWWFVSNDISFIFTQKKLGKGEPILTFTYSSDGWLNRHSVIPLKMGPSERCA